ncbi:MAG: hypothetical protein JJT94_02710 [Bernardetiaceae bacterium]|nr:hypothetical protein [Bernardetiaceae bacterium]
MQNHHQAGREGVKAASAIYDVVFKYLMDDLEIAKQIISIILGTEVISLKPRTKEYSKKIQKNTENSKLSGSASISQRTSLTIARLDFSAEIRTEEGMQIVVIEIQKAHRPDEIMTFRNYIGRQFQDEQAYVIKERKNGIEYKVGLPIIGIYFLGDGLETLENTLALQIDTTCKDMHSGTYLTLKEPFVDSLTTKIYIFNLPAIRDKSLWRDELDMLLSLFDRRIRDKEEKFFLLSLNELDYAETLRPIVNRLITAFQDTQIKEKMEQENMLFNDFQTYENQIERLKNQVAKIESEKEKILHENIETGLILKQLKEQIALEKKRLAEKEATTFQEKLRREEEQRLREEEQKLREKEQKRREEEQKRREEEQRRFIEFLYSSTSKNLDLIQEITGFEQEVIQKIIQEIEAAPNNDENSDKKD